QNDLRDQAVHFDPPCSSALTVDSMIENILPSMGPACTLLPAAPAGNPPSRHRLIFSQPGKTMTGFGLTIPSRAIRFDLAIPCFPSAPLAPPTLVRPLHAVRFAPHEQSVQRDAKVGDPQHLLEAPIDLVRTGAWDSGP